MSARVKLTVTQGLSEGKSFVFRERTIGTVGRADDCLLRLPSSVAHLDVSRHHCLLDINPPEICVRDLGSKNGTYVNGIKIGQRTWGLPPEGGAVCDMPEYFLEEGDELRVGSTVFRVEISEAAWEEEEFADDQSSLVG